MVIFLCDMVSISFAVNESVLTSAIHQATIVLCAFSLHLNCALNISIAFCCSSSVKFPSNNNIISGLALFL
ncbi:hypothetical protein IJD44_06040 [bacterium]|nr:hypothetical protein [bacterium]